LFSGNCGEFNSLNTSCGVKGGLSATVDFWKSTPNAPEFVVDIITVGFLSRDIGPHVFGKYRSAFQHPEFVSQVTCELLENDCIVEHSAPPFCVNPLSVAKGKKLRLVIDLRHVNNFLVRLKFKYEDLHSLSHVLEEGHWFFACDIRSGYYYVDICVKHQTHLGFSWRFNGVPRYLTFAVLPFGLSSACFCFTKLLQPLV